MANKFENNYSNLIYGISYAKLRYHSLHHAIYDRRLIQVKLLLKLQPDLINFRTDLGLTPLMIACLLPESERRNNIIKLLIKAPLLNPYCRDHGKRSVIFYFIKYLKLYDLKEFLQVSNFNYFTQTDIDGFTILHYAVVRENLEILEFVFNIFLRYKINIDTPSNVNLTPLLLACKLSKYRSAALIIKMGANYFNVRDNDFFRNCLEWLEHNKENKLVITEDELFYFDKFEMEHDLISGISTDAGTPRLREIKPQSARVQNGVAKYLTRECSLTDSIKSRSNTCIFSRLESEDNVESKSLLVMEIENMPLDDLEEFVIGALKNNKKKSNIKKRVSIIINDRIFLPKRNSITVDSVPLCRETSANIAHRLLNRVAVYYC